MSRIPVLRWRAAAIGLAAAGLLMALPAAQAEVCSGNGCAFPSDPVFVESCPGGCVEVREIRVLLNTANGQQLVVDAAGICLGVYAGPVFPINWEINAGVVVRLPHEPSDHIAVGAGAMTC